MKLLKNRLSFEFNRRNTEILNFVNSFFLQISLGSRERFQKFKTEIGTITGCFYLPIEIVTVFDKIWVV